MVKSSTLVGHAHQRSATRSSSVTFVANRDGWRRTRRNLRSRFGVVPRGGGGPPRAWRGWSRPEVGLTSGTARPEVARGGGSAAVPEGLPRSSHDHRRPRKARRILDQGHLADSSARHGALPCLVTVVRSFASRTDLTLARRRAATPCMTSTTTPTTTTTAPATTSRRSPHLTPSLPSILAVCGREGGGRATGPAQ